MWSYGPNPARAVPTGREIAVGSRRGFRPPLSVLGHIPFVPIRGSILLLLKPGRLQMIEP